MRAHQRSARRVRVRAVTLVAALAALITTSCAAGRDAQTADQTPAIDGSSATVGRIDLRAVAIEPPPNDVMYAKGSSAELTMVIVNTGAKPDTLTGITSPQFSAWGRFANPEAAAEFAAGKTATAAPATSVPLPEGQTTTFGLSYSTGVLVATGLAQALHPAQSIPMTFTFATAGSITIHVPVQLTETPGTSVIPPIPSDDA